MSKKLILASLIASSLMISCSDESTEISSAENSALQKGTSNKISSNEYVSFPVTLNIGEASENNIGVNSTIEVNPNYPYYSDYNVYASDGYYSTPTPNCLNDGKPCINLSHFLAMKGAYLKPYVNPGASRTAIFYGEMGEYDFAQYPRPNVPGVYSDREASFVVQENGSSSPLFNYSTYMTNDAANAILHHFKDRIKDIQKNDNEEGEPKIFAVHFRYNSWFGMSTERQVKMRVRYYYN